MLEKEFRYYVDHQDEFVEKYNGSVIILRDEEVLEVFDTMSDAYFHAEEKGWLGEVMIQKVGPGKENYTITLHSALVFS